MNNIRITLYDIFGFLLPGAFTFIGLYLIAWKILFPSQVQDWSGITTGGWISLLILFYIFGHIAQAIVNAVIHKIPKYSDEKQKQNIFSNLPEEIKDKVFENLHSLLKVELAKNDVSTALDLMDHYVQQHGNCESREIYTYREGFYRGFAVALFLLAIGLFFKCSGPDGWFMIFGTKITLASKTLLYIGIMAFVMIFPILQRYLRFKRYRVLNTVYSFIAIYKEEQGDD